MNEVSARFFLLDKGKQSEQKQLVALIHYSSFVSSTSVIFTRRDIKVLFRQLRTQQLMQSSTKTVFRSGYSVSKDIISSYKTATPIQYDC